MMIARMMHKFDMHDIEMFVLIILFPQNRLAYVFLTVLIFKLVPASSN